MSSVRFAAFYLSRTPARDRQVVVIKPRGEPALTVYVRTEEIAATTLEDAHLKAHPRSGETLMNVHIVRED